jgi:hypothetical protein
MKKEPYTLEEADIIWTAAARRGYKSLENALNTSPSQPRHKASTLTR